MFSPQEQRLQILWSEAVEQVGKRAPQLSAARCAHYNSKAVLISECRLILELFLVSFPVF